MEKTMPEVRLVDANALYRKVKMECNPYGKPTIGFEDGKKVLELIDKQPTIEAEPVRHGSWIKSDTNTFKKCSECGSVWDAALCDNIFFVYCPRCGSKNGGVDSAGSKTD